MTANPQPRQHATARAAYAFHQERAKAAIARLQEVLAKDEREFENDFKNWGFPGSMAHVATEIESIATFLAGEPR
jgi:hypothetical protein